MSDFLGTIASHKEIIGVVGSVITGSVGVAKTLSEVLRGRSRISERDKLLERIQRLLAVQQGMTSVSLDAGLEAIHSDLASALAEFDTVSQKVRERQDFSDLGLFQRAFLLFRPSSVGGWVAHLACWSLELILPLGFFGTWLSEDGDEASWTVFVQNWKDPATYIAFSFFIGLFLLARLWAIADRKRSLRKGTARNNATGFPWRAVFAVVYGIIALTSIVAAVALMGSDAGAGVRFGIFGINVGACAGILYPLKTRKSTPGRSRNWLYLLPPAILVLIVIFDVGGIVLKQSANDPLSYWRYWRSEPYLPLFCIPFAALPFYFTFLRLRKPRADEAAKSVAVGANSK